MNFRPLMIAILASMSLTDHSSAANEEKIKTSSRKFMDAAIFFLNGQETSADYYAGDSHYKSMVGDYKLTDGCTLVRNNEGSETLYNFNSLTGKYYAGVDGDKYSITAIGTNAICFAYPNKPKDCHDDISRDYQNAIIRDRAIKALSLIVEQYCEPGQEKAF